MSEYYDRDGTPLTLEQWVAMFNRQEKKRVAETILPDGKWVSTVWLGLNHAFGDDGPPLIFETMVFPAKDGPLSELDMDRYSTEAEARAGHKAMVTKWKDGVPHERD